ncbi:MAG: hypothetical protein NC218_10250 [Acetobacter sp.]|nr:hypothetical protein [Acetobacter sp.]
MQKYFIYLILTTSLCWLSYIYGKSQSKTEIIEKQVEIIKYETKEICKIMAKPNLDDDNIVKLFRAGKL